MSSKFASTHYIFQHPKQCEAYWDEIEELCERVIQLTCIKFYEEQRRINTKFGVPENYMVVRYRQVLWEREQGSHRGLS